MHRFGRLFHYYFQPIAIVFFCTVIGILIASAYSFGNTLVEAQALQQSQASMQTIKTAWQLYHNTVIQPLTALENSEAQAETAAETAADIETIISGPNDPPAQGTILAPVTYLMRLSEQLQTDETNPQFLIHSDYPFPQRRKNPTQTDSFQREALAYLSDRPNEEFSRMESLGNTMIFSYAAPLVMDASCVACHNIHPDSPKQDWQVGSVAGILTIRQPLQAVTTTMNQGIQQFGLIAGLLAGVGLAGGIFLKVEDDRTRQRLRDEIAHKTIALERLDLTDPLTHIANQRQFFEALDKEWRRVWRQNGHLSLLRCDVDYFAEYNELYGTDAGDDCLKAIATTIDQRLKRAGDLVARIGHHQFCVLLPETTPPEAEEVAAIIMDAVHNLKLVHAQSDVSPYVSLSIGIASTIPSKSHQPKDLLELAEQVLHQDVKELGHNDFAVRQL